MKLSKITAVLLATALISSVQAMNFGSITKMATEAVTPSSASTSSGLIGALTSGLGVTSTQASGGAAALLGSAASKMSADNLSSLTSAVPALSSMMGGGSSSGLLGLAGTAVSALSVGDQFSSLGLDAGMITKFMPIILNYVQGEGGSDAMNLLKTAF
ncbi:MAG: DUF2780 domain-containing protein [Sulfurimonas sp.]|nr:DUF2780 domain-containing protein [Sulfurimonas sp.]